MENQISQIVNPMPEGNNDDVNFLKKKLQWYEYQHVLQQKYSLLSTEEQQVLKNGDYFNRKGYFKFLTSKKLERLLREIESLKSELEKYTSKGIKPT